MSLWWRRSHPDEIGIATTIVSAVSAAAGGPALIAAFNVALRGSRGGIRAVVLLSLIAIQVNARLYPAEEPYLLTKGGPTGSTRSIAVWVYEQFGFGNISAAMAGSVLLLLLVGIVAIVQFRMLRPKH